MIAEAYSHRGFCKSTRSNHAASSGASYGYTTGRHSIISLRMELDETKAELDQAKANLSSSDTFVGVFLVTVTFIPTPFAIARQ